MVVGSCKGRWWFDGVGKGWPARGPAWFGFFCKIQKEEEKKVKS
jgi:hypothetical protein